MSVGRRRGLGMAGLAAVTLLVLAVLGLPTAGRGSVAVAKQFRCGAYGKPEAQLPLAAARRFRRFDLFFAGSRAAGFPLTAVLCTMMPTADRPTITRPPESYGLMPSWTFIYGTCHSSGSEGGCSTPVDISNDGSCWSNLALFTKRDRPKLHGLRGVPSAGGRSDNEAHLTLYTRRTTIGIDAPSTAAARRIALALRSLDSRYSARSRLLPASHRTLYGHTKCRAR
jgi:hypothetical protein